MEPLHVRVRRVNARISDDRRFLLVTLSASDGSAVTLELEPGALPGLIASLTRLNQVIVDGIAAEEGGPEGPGN